MRFQPGTVPTAPKVISVAAPLLVPENSRVVLAPAVRGAGPLSYQWSRSGISITGATNAWLGVGDVQAASYGAYTVSITNSFGTTQTSFELEAPARLALAMPRGLPHDRQLQVHGSDNLEFTIEYSADLQTWRTLTGGQLVDGRAVVLIPESIIGNHAFFRGRYLPFGVDDD